MIKYKLFCNDCFQDFDSWFGNSKEFEKLKKNKLLSCPNCNSAKINYTGSLYLNWMNVNKNNHFNENYKDGLQKK